MSRPMQVVVAKVGALRSCQRWAIFPRQGGEPLWLGPSIYSPHGTRRAAVAHAQEQGWEVWRDFPR